MRGSTVGISLHFIVHKYTYNELLKNVLKNDKHENN